MRVSKANFRTWAGQSRSIGYMLGIVTGVCFGSWGVIAKSTMADYDIPPFLFAGISFTFGTIIFAPVLAYGVPRAVSISKRSLGFFALSGCGYGLAFLALSFGLERENVAVLMPIFAINPLITLVLVKLFLDRMEILTLPVMAGALLVVGGTALVVVGDSIT